MMQDGKPSADKPAGASRQGTELALFVTVGHVARHVRAAFMLAAFEAGAASVALLLRRGTGGLQRAGLIAAITVGLIVLLPLWLHVKRIKNWLRWRRRPLPALRLSASGLDYSPAYTGDFPLQVDWATADVLRSEFHQGSDNTGFVWCLYAPFIDGIDPLPAFIRRSWPLDRGRVWREMRELIRQSGIDKRSPQQMAAATHLVYFGTPIVLNLAYASGSPLAEVDAYLRERTGGRCTLSPERKPVPPTVRGPV